MPSFKNAVVAAAAALVAAVQADYYIVPSSVPLATRQSWCESELSSCPLICDQVPPGSTKSNTCDADTLTYGCLCGNGLQPNVSQYTLTLPYFVCQEWGTQCVKACGSDNACANSCRQDHPCGAQNPQRVNTTTSSTMPATATATSSNQVFTGLAGSPSTTASSNMAPALESGRILGLALTLGGLLAGVAILL